LLYRVLLHIIFLSNLSDNECLVYCSTTSSKSSSSAIMFSFLLHFTSHTAVVVAFGLSFIYLVNQYNYCFSAIIWALFLIYFITQPLHNFHHQFNSSLQQ